MALASGSHLGQYEILAPLGAGGMGEVYRARDTKLGREVAIKILPEAFAADAERVARFQREARTLASLNHPNIAIIHGLEQAGTVNALVMELVDGQDLSERIARLRAPGASARQAGMPLDEVLPIATQIAEALEAAHDQGIVHRDLKPANIKVRDDGRVKVLDFGLAKAIETAGAAGSTLTQSPTITSPAMTQAGMILGTAAYMSPEQAKGRPADKRSDVWSFGCVLYEMLTGARPFDGEDTTDVLGAVVRLEPDWSRVPPTVPPGILALVKGCLVKDRRQRVGDIAAALFAIKTPALSTVAEAHVTATPVKPQAWTARAVPLVVVAAIVAAATWQAVTTLRRPAPVAPPHVTRFPIALGDGQQFTNAGRNTVAISPDGSKIAYVANRTLYLRSLSELVARPIADAGGRGITSPVFSPDGLSLAFYEEGGSLKRIGVNGGTADTLCPAENPFGMSWSDDGIVVGQGPGGILRVAPNGGTPVPLVTMKEGEVAHGPHLLPGGEAVLFTLATNVGVDRWEKAQIVAQRISSGERRVLVNGGSDARYVATGHLVYTIRGNLFAVRFDPHSLMVTGAPSPVVEGVRRAIGGGSNQPATTHMDVSDTGTLIYVSGPSSGGLGDPRGVAFVDRRGQTTILKVPPGAYEAPRLSPDGTRVALGSNDDAEASIWIYALSGTTAIQRLTLRGTGRNRYPIWSPDSQRITFQSDREKDTAIFWQRADGTGTAERLTRPEPGTTHTPESWSPTGDTLLFSVARESTSSIWTWSLRDHTAKAFGAPTSSENMDPVFSPDGHWVAYDVVSGAPPQVYVEPFPPTGDRYLVTTNQFAFNPFWSADGKALIFSPRAGFSAVTVSTRPGVTFGNPVSVPRGGFTSQEPGGRRSWDAAPDGERIVGIIDGTAAAVEGTPVIQVVLNWTEELKSKVPNK